MNQIKRRSLLVGFLVLPAALSAAPMISIDSADYDAGELFEGSTSVARHTFVVKNTGDKELKIENVKPSCGCTAVGFDSVIAPGKTGKITQEIRLNGIHGPFRKYMTVASNSKNSPSLRVSLGGVLRSELEFSPDFVRLQHPENQNEWQTEITITSLQKDLLIQEAQFKPDDFGQSGPSWQEAIPIFLTPNLAKSAKPRTDGYTEYTLKLTLPFKGPLDKNGIIMIKTNNQKKPELAIRGVFDGK